MKNLILITNLKQAIDTNNQQAGSKVFYDEIAKLSLIEQYYWIKGLKIANRDVFYDTYYEVKSINQKYVDLLVNILNSLYWTSNSEDEKVAYKGMGNIQEYVDAINTVF